MPQALPLIAGYVASGTILAGTYLTGTALVFAQFAIGGIVSYGTTKLLGLDEVPGMQAPGIQANVKGTVQPIPIVYGRRRVGGALCQLVTTGNVQTQITIPPVVPGGGVYDIPDRTDNKFLNIVLAWCEGEVDGVVNLYFDDTLSTASSLAGFFTVEHYVGTDDQLASDALIQAIRRTFDDASSARLWSTDHRLRGVAYSYFKLKYDVSAWPTGIPTITVDLKGRKVLDFRTGVTAWSDNPALIVYDYLTNARYGFGLPDTDLDLESFTEAANYCEQLIFIETQAAIPPDVPQAGVTQARYACDAVLNPDDSLLDNLATLLSTCQGALVFAGGKYRLKLDKPEVPSFALTEDNIVGGWNILLESTETRYNRVQAQWIDKSRRYQEDFAIVASDEYLAADAGEVLEARPDFRATTNIYRARQLAGLILRQSRYSLQCEVTCTIAAAGVEVFDVVTVTHPIPGWVDQEFRVMGVSLTPDDQVKLQLRQYAAAVYDLDSQNEEDSPPPTNLPDPRVVRKVDFLEGTGYFEARSDGTYRSWIEAVWYITQVPPANLSHFELRWRLAGSGLAWAVTTIPADAFGSVNAPIPVDVTAYRYEFDAVQLATYETEVVAVNLLGVRSPVTTATMTAAGSPVAPDAPSAVHLSGLQYGVRARWTNGAGAARVEVRMSQTSSSFATSSLMATLTGEGYDIVSQPVGTTTYVWLRSVSQAGLYSDWTPASSGPGLSYVSGVPTYSSDAAAGLAGLLAGDLWLDSSAGNTLKVKA